MEALPVKMKRLCALFLALVLTLGLCSCSIGKKGKYEKAVEAVRNGHYTEAIENLEALEGYEDSAKYIAYARAIQAGDSGDYEAAITALKALNGFERSAVYITSYTTLAAEAERARMKDTYNQAVADVKAGKYDEAISAFETLNDYGDSGKYIMYARCLKAGDSGDYETAIKSLTALGDFKEAGMYIQYFTALRYEANQQYEEAGEVYDGILLFKDAQARNAALPDKILDRDLAEAEREFEQEKSWSSLREMIGKTYTTSATRMYENVMGFAAKLHEKQDYEKAAAAYYLLLTEANYEKADAGFKESFYQYVCVLMTDGEYADAREYINEYISGYKDADERALECSYQLALRLEARGTEKAQAAYNAFKELATYKDSADHAAAYEAKYAEATSKREANDFDAAIALFSELGTYSDASAKRKEAQNAKAYAAAASLMNSEQYEEAIEAFRALNGYSDSTAQIEACEAAILEREYQKAVKLKTDEQYEEAIEAFRALNGYSDGTAQIEACEAAILEREYQKAIKLKTDEKYEEAIEAFRALNGYSDSAEQIETCETAILEREYQKAIKLLDEGKRDEAIQVFRSLNGYKDSNEQIRYQQALQAEAAGAKKAQATYDAFKALGTYKDSAERAAAYETKYAEAISERESGDFDAAIALFTELGTYLDSAAQIKETQNAKAYAAAVSLMNDEKYEEAIKAFRALNGYSDSAEQIMECTYRTAEKLRKSGKYAEAYVIYATIQDYKDVGEIMTNDAGIAKVVAYQPGNYVTFGTYPQTKSGTDQTPIEWLVLESDGETALLISRYALDAEPYNNKLIDTTWEKCTLRRWLNNDFYNRAFSAEEKKTILVSDVSADKNPRHDTDPGNATKDLVFLLSIVEAKKYFANKEARMCAATDYAIKQGTYTNSDYTVDGRKACWWWLRSPGRSGDNAAYVNTDGSIFSNDVNRSRSAVRSCVRVRLF